MEASMEQTKKMTRNRVMEIFERLIHLNEIADQNLNGSRRIRDLLLGSPDEGESKPQAETPNPTGILDRMIGAIQEIHQVQLKIRDENSQTLHEIQPGK